MIQKPLHIDYIRNFLQKYMGAFEISKYTLIDFPREKTYNGSSDGKF